MSNIRLINDKRSILDLSAVKDAEGKMIILQPKGTKGSSRECHGDVLDHPHVQNVIKARWAHAEKISLSVPVEEVPPAVEPVPPPAEPPVDATSNAPTPPPPAEAPSSAEEAPALETEPAEPSVAEPVVTSSETLELGESLTTSVVNANDGKNKNKGKGRNDR
jgi:hypothetical protein